MCLASMIKGAYPASLDQWAAIFVTHPHAWVSEVHQGAALKPSKYVDLNERIKLKKM